MPGKAGKKSWYGWKDTTGSVEPKKSKNGINDNNSNNNNNSNNHPFKYTQGIKVLCPYYDGKIYQAKILSRRTVTNDKKQLKEEYFLKFHGWSPNYNEWVDVNELAPKTDEYIQSMKIINDRLKNKNKKVINKKFLKKNNNNSNKNDNDNTDTAITTKGNQNANNSDINNNNNNTKNIKSEKHLLELIERKIRKKILNDANNNNNNSKKKNKNKNKGKNKNRNKKDNKYMSNEEDEENEERERCIGLYDEKESFKNRSLIGKSLKLNISSQLKNNLVCQWKMLMDSQNNHFDEGYIIPLPKSKEYSIREILNQFDIWIKNKCNNDIKKFQLKVLKLKDKEIEQQQQNNQNNQNENGKGNEDGNGNENENINNEQDISDGSLSNNNSNSENNSELANNNNNENNSNSNQPNIRRTSRRACAVAAAARLYSNNENSNNNNGEEEKENKKKYKKRGRKNNNNNNFENFDINLLSLSDSIEYKTLLKNIDLYSEMIYAVKNLFNHIVFRSLLFQIEFPQGNDLQKQFKLNKIKYGKLIDTTINYSQKNTINKNKNKKNNNKNINNKEEQKQKEKEKEKEKSKNENDCDIVMSESNNNSNNNSNSNSNNSSISNSKSSSIELIDTSHILEPIDIYGAEHLIRLFVKLPQIVDEFVGFSEAHSVSFKERLNLLVKFLSLSQNTKYFQYCNEESPTEFRKLVNVDNKYLKRVRKIQIQLD